MKLIEYCLTEGEEGEAGWEYYRGVKCSRHAAYMYGLITMKSPHIINV
jgi:hypothetical protein